MVNDMSKLPCDIVRDMFACLTMHDVAKLLDLLLADPQIELLRFKDRFNYPSSGYRDVMINYYHREDEQRHVCELQLVHASLLTALCSLTVIVAACASAWHLVWSTRI